MSGKSAGNTRLVWFRDDLRIGDNPALHAAAEPGDPVIALYVLDEGPGVRRFGGAERWWLHHSLLSLSRSLEAAGTSLILRRGNARDIVVEIAKAASATAVHWNEVQFVPERKRDAAIAEALTKAGIAVEVARGVTLQNPDDVATQSGSPFHVFTPFWRSVRSMDPGEALPAARQLKAPRELPRSDKLAAWKLLPTKPDWAKGIARAWEPGEAQAKRRLAAFLDDSVDSYDAGRNRPGEDRTSRLSPHLRWGEISARQVWHAVLDHEASRGHKGDRAAEIYLSELGWREFSHHLLQHHAELPEEPLRPEFAAFPWQPDPALLRAWQQGRTGYPIVDAGMRQLWTAGWMHNRVRMIVASFLTKDLLQPWQDGAAWFLDTLVDADIASNSQNWQWVAGCGPDAAPYFRVFNPVLQGQKFDPEGDYVREWVPELKDRPAAQIHDPVDEPTARQLGYVTPIVDHKAARAAALEAYGKIRR